MSPIPKKKVSRKLKPKIRLGSEAKTKRALFSKPGWISEEMVGKANKRPLATTKMPICSSVVVQAKSRRKDKPVFLYHVYPIKVMLFDSNGKIDNGAYKRFITGGNGSKTIRQAVHTFSKSAKDWEKMPKEERAEKLRTIKEKLKKGEPIKVHDIPHNEVILQMASAARELSPKSAKIEMTGIKGDPLPHRFGFVLPESKKAYESIGEVGKKLKEDGIIDNLHLRGSTAKNKKKAPGVVTVHPGGRIYRGYVKPNEL